MTVTVGETAERLASALLFEKAAGWDPVGLQIGDPQAIVTKIAVCHEITDAAANRLIEGKIDLAVVYHPLLFRPVTNVIAGSSPAGRAHRLIANGVSVVVAHTAFDVIPGGAADALAEALGLMETSSFGPIWGSDGTKVVTFVPEARVDAVADAMAAAGAGNIGHYANCSFRAPGVGTFLPTPPATPFSGEIGVVSHEDEIRLEMACPEGRIDAVLAALGQAHPYDEPAYDVIETKSNAGFIGRQGRLGSRTDLRDFARRVSDRLGGVVRVAGAGAVSTVAAVPGSGGSYLLANSADVVVTGDVSHHQAAAAVAAGRAIIDPGHSATERPGVKALYAAVAETVDNVVDMTDLDPDPWKEP